jgi:hypothetical protein
VIPARLALPPVENSGTRSRFRIEIAQNLDGIDCDRSEICSSSGDRKTSICRPLVVAGRRDSSASGPGDKTDFCAMGRELGTQ